MGIRRSVLAVLLACVLAGCAVDATLTVRVRDDGSGRVTVDVVADREAVGAVELGGVPIDDAVRLSDLADGGWTVGTWVRADDGSATLTLDKPFDSVDEVAGIVRELNGDLGPLPRLRATRDYGLLTTDYAVVGRIDLARTGSGVADDPELAAALVALGVDVAVIDEQLRAQVQSSFGLEVVVRLPQAPLARFAPRDGATSASISATSSVRNTQRVLYLIAAVGFLGLAAIVWLRGGRRRGRGRGRGRGPTPSPAPAPRGARRGPEPSPGRGPAGRRPPGRPPAPPAPPARRR